MRYEAVYAQVGCARPVGCGVERHPPVAHFRDKVFCEAKVRSPEEETCRHWRVRERRYVSLHAANISQIHKRATQFLQQRVIGQSVGLSLHLLHLRRLRRWQQELHCTRDDNPTPSLNFPSACTDAFTFSLFLCWAAPKRGLHTRQGQTQKHIAMRMQPALSCVLGN